VDAFSRASEKEIPYQISPRREGDIASCYADPSYALKTIGWTALHSLENMCLDAWNYQVKNPKGLNG
jgi:UDP-glucose 4-epimerase